MALRGKVFWIAAASGLLMRALLWLLSALGFSVSSQNDGWIAFGVAAGVAFLVVIDEVDGMRRTYAQELWKVRVEANREAIEWLRANGGLEHLRSGLDGCPCHGLFLLSATMGVRGIIRPCSGRVRLGVTGGP